MLISRAIQRISPAIETVAGRFSRALNEIQAPVPTREPHIIGGIGVRDAHAALAEMPAAMQPQTMIDMWSGAFGSKKFSAHIDPGSVEVHIQQHPTGNFATGTAIGVIKNSGGNKVGEFSNIVKLKPDGTLHVKHDRMFIKDTANQDSGFASGFFAHAEEAYRALGVADIKLTAVQVGAYAWAKAGYEFASGGLTATQKLTNRARTAARVIENAHKLGQISDAEFGALSLRMFKDEMPRPKKMISSTKHILALGDDLAKRVLINSTWDGVKAVSA